MPRPEARMEEFRCRQCNAIVALIAKGALQRGFTLCCPECGVQREIKPSRLDIVEKQVYTSLVPV